MSKTTLFAVTLLIGQIFFFDAARGNEPVPCACPQWQWGSWSDSQGNVHYSYYSKMCDGVTEPYWVSLDSMTDYGAFPGGDCTNAGGCAAPSIPQFDGGTEGKGTQSAAASTFVAPVHAVEKSNGNKIGLGERGLGKAELSSARWPRSVTPRLAADGGATVLNVNSPVILKVRVKNKMNTDVELYVRLFKVTLNPDANTNSSFQHKTGETAIQFGVGIEVEPGDGSSVATIPWIDVETVNPKKQGTSPFTSCIRFDHDGHKFQVITAEKVKMK